MHTSFCSSFCLVGEIGVLFDEEGLIFCVTCFSKAEF